MVNQIQANLTEQPVYLVEAIRCVAQRNGYIAAAVQELLLQIYGDSGFSREINARADAFREASWDHAPPQAQPQRRSSSPAEHRAASRRQPCNDNQVAPLQDQLAEQTQPGVQLQRVSEPAGDPTQEQEGHQHLHTNPYIEPCAPAMACPSSAPMDIDQEERRRPPVLVGAGRVMRSPLASELPNGWDDLEEVQLEAEYRIRVPVMETVPRSIRRDYARILASVVYNLQQAYSTTEDVEAPLRTSAWKLFCLLSRMLLHRMARGGQAGTRELAHRIRLFDSGRWSELLQRSHACAAGRSRRQNRQDAM